MNNILDIKSPLSVILGRGFLSLYEINTLSVGDVIMSDKPAENPCLLLLNNNFLCRCEVVVLDKQFGVRIMDMVNDDLPPVSPGVVEEAMEILPVSIRLDEISVSLKELQGLTYGSLVGLEREYSDEEDTELLAAGIPVASGKAVYVDDNIGMRITRVYSPKTENIELRSSTYRISAGIPGPEIKEYSFKRPRKFSSKKLAKLNKIHAGYLQTLQLLVPGIKDHHLIGTEETMYHEIFEKLNGRYFYHVIEIDAHTGRGKDPVYDTAKGSDGKTAKKAFLAQADSPHYPKEWDFSPDRQAFKAMKATNANALIWASKKGSVFSRIDSENGIKELILSPLKNGWKSLLNIDFRFLKRSDDPKEVEILPPNNMVLVFAMGEEGSKEPDSILIYPYIAIEPVIHLLS
jgi:flagellar motor switch/type III secretory pathway protein FliN